MELYQVTPKTKKTFQSMAVCFNPTKTLPENFDRSCLNSISQIVGKYKT